jgi:transglutaminase-like putative cysteine protease
MMHFDIRYHCRFDYDEAVRESQNELRVAPTSDARQQLLSYRASTEPNTRVFSFIDYWGTRVDTFGVREPHQSLDIVAEATVETARSPLMAGTPRFEDVAAPSFADEHIEYLARSPHCDWGGAIADEAARVHEMAGEDLVGLVLALHRRVGSTLRYSPGSTFVGVPVDGVFERRAGVCQDFAHLAVSMCRAVRIPARYVSGYLFTTRDDENDDPEGPAVRVQTHAWFEAALPGHGWLALDPTNGSEVGLRHVKIGHGRDYDDVQPLRGVFSGLAAQSMEVTVNIRKMDASDAARASVRREATISRPARVLAQSQQQ